MKGWTMRNRNTLLAGAGWIVLGAVMLTAATTSAAASDPNATAANPLDLSNLSVSKMQDVLSQVYAYLAKYGLKILGAVLIFIVGRWVARLLSNLAGTAMTKAKMDLMLVQFIKDLSYVGMLTFVVIAALANVGVQTASFIAVLGAAGLAVGLALQGSLSNFAAGVLMLIFKPLRVGDFVEAGGAKGTVKEIGIFTTILSSPDNVRIIVPNSQVMGGNISNYTINGTRRVDLVIGISYEDDMKKAKEVIEGVLAGDRRILPDPAPVVAVSELAESSVNLVVRPWVNCADYWPTYFDLTAQIKLALEANGLTIPFPQRDVHLKNGNLVAAAGGRT